MSDFITSEDLNNNLSKHKLLGLYDRCTCQDGRRYNRAKKKWEPCEECERGLKWKVGLERVRNADNKTMLDRLCIPDYYKNCKDLNLDVLNTLDKCVPSHIYNVRSFMEDIRDSIFKGKVKACSFYLYIETQGNTRVDIRQWVYSMLKDGVMNGLSVVPFITLRRLYDLSLLNSFSFDRLKEIEQRDISELVLQSDITIKAIADFSRVNKLTYQSYILADLVVLEVSPNTFPTYWMTLKDLVVERSRLNLPTYIIGWWPWYKLNQDVFLIDKFDSGRLDLLKVVELKQPPEERKRIRIEAEKKEEMEKAKSKKSYPDVRSNVVTGVNINEFMRPRD